MVMPVPMRALRLLMSILVVSDNNPFFYESCMIANVFHRGLG